MRLFISYARADVEYAKKLADLLKAARYDIWFDANLSMGEDWEYKIRFEIGQCDVFIYLASNTSVKSRPCRQEIDIALEARKLIVPIALDIPIQLPFSVAHLQYADVSEGIPPDFADQFTGGLNRLTQEAQADKPLHGEYFVGHTLTDENTPSLRAKISSVFDDAGYRPFYAEGGTGGITLARKCREIFAARFCLFDISQADPDVYIELGIALGFNKPTLILTRVETAIPAALRSIDSGNIIRYASFSDLQKKLSDRYYNGFPPKTSRQPNTCYFCDRLCSNMSTPPDPSRYLILNNENPTWQDVIEIITPAMIERKLAPEMLHEPRMSPTLCDLRRQTLMALFGVCHLGDMADMNSYLAMGMVIGSKLPWIVLYQRGSGEIPQNLQGFDRIEYHTLYTFETDQGQTLKKFLNNVKPIQSIRTGVLDKMINPFWQDLKEWISKQAPLDTHVQEDFQGRLRIIEKDGDRFLTKHNFPIKGKMVFGRNTARCDVILNHAIASGEHFQIVEGANGKYYIEDLDSQNGTYLNGSQLKAHVQDEIHFQDTIIVAGWLYEFQVWDQRPVPGEDTPQLTIGTAPLNEIQIHIDDIIPPKETRVLKKGNYIVHHENLPVKIEVPTYYPMGQIVDQLVKIMSERFIGRFTEKNKKYRFSYHRQLVNNDATPASMGLEDRALLVLISDPVERAHQVTYERITGCDDRSCGSLGVMPSGEEFGTLRELFNDTYRRLYPEEPLPTADIKLPVMFCPICQQVIKETGRVRTGHGH